jgi:hypothetical protein
MESGVSPTGRTPGHASVSSNAGEVSLTCPECRAVELVELDAAAVTCTGCNKTIRCVACGRCGHTFATVKPRKCQCPRCLHSIRGRAGFLPFMALEQQRVKGIEPPDLEMMTGLAQSLDHSRESRLRPRRLWAAGVILVIVAIGLGVTIGSSKRKPSASTRKTTSASLHGTHSAACPISHSIAIASSRNSAGDYVVSATGTVTNNGASPLVNVQITWVTTYSDLSVGLPTTTSIGGGVIVSKGDAASWTGLSSTNDGTVPPTGARIVRLSYNDGATTCAF